MFVWQDRAYNERGCFQACSFTLSYAGLDESPTARVQRGSSETARCASTGDSPGPLLADFFSILLEEIADQLYSLFWRGSSMNEMRREIFEQAHPGLVGTQQNHGLLCFQR